MFVVPDQTVETVHLRDSKRAATDGLPRTPRTKYASGNRAMDQAQSPATAGPEFDSGQENGLPIFRGLVQGWVRSWTRGRPADRSGSDAVCGMVLPPRRASSRWTTTPSCKWTETRPRLLSPTTTGGGDRRGARSGGSPP